LAVVVYDLFAAAAGEQELDRAPQALALVSEQNGTPG
jgi:hypothetical protein